MASPTVDQLALDVAAESTVVDSAIVALNGINQRIVDGIAAAQAGDFSVLTQLSTDITAKTTALADAVVNNTPQSAMAGTGKVKAVKPKKTP